MATADLLENVEDITFFQSYALKRVKAMGRPDIDFQILDSTSSPPVCTPITIEELRDPANTPPPVRIVFVPTDLPDKTNLTALNALYDLYNYPSAYRVERFQSITHSFGARENDAWLHFQCKGMKVQMGPSPGKLVMVGAGGTTGADITWKYSGFHLSWSTPKQGKSDVVLVCSGDNSNLHERMMPFMAVQANVEEVCRDPHALWVPVLFEMWKTMDCEVWGLENVFDSEKENIVEISTDITQSLKNIDFRRLHNLAKHAIYLKEASDATLLMIDSILDLHDGTKFPQTHRSLKYTRGLFQSVNLSLVSEGKNIDNTINLAFNLVSQRDSRQAREDSVIMKQDSTNMRLMSMVAMVYLPGTAVASIFGSNFFSMNESRRLIMSDNFWVFWAIALPVSVLTLLTWKVVVMKDEVSDWIRDIVTRRRPKGDGDKLSMGA